MIDGRCARLRDGCRGQPGDERAARTARRSRRCWAHARGARRAAAGVGAARARTRARDARVWARSDAGLLREGGGGGGSRSISMADAIKQALALLEGRLRERFPGLRIAGGHSPPFRALTRSEEEQVAADDRRLRRAGGVGRHRPAQAGVVDAPHAPAPAGTAAGGRGGGLRLPRGPASHRRRAGCSATGLSGFIAWYASRGGCGGATRATTRASWRPSPRSTRASDDARASGNARAESARAAALEPSRRQSASRHPR